MSGTVGIILAAGVGSRLRPLTDDRPKCLLSLGHETILHRAVRLLCQAGVDRLIVATGYRQEMVRTALSTAPVNVTFVHNPDYANTQNAVSLALALEAVRPGEHCIKMDGDLVCTPDVVRTMATGGSADMVVAVDRSTHPSAEAMKVSVDDREGRRRLLRFGKGIDSVLAYGESIGMEWIHERAVPVVAEAMRAAVTSGQTDLYYEDVYNRLLDELAVVAEWIHPSAWTEIDDVDDLVHARARFGTDG